MLDKLQAWHENRGRQILLLGGWIWVACILGAIGWAVIVISAKMALRGVLNVQ